eukprot:TRINITY_DN294_c0_g3_i1.p2 TRINITY_DN294_c0_g3~~TRINITY_DN294_c0_g3_i1.p2  ORF type:complete len:151 (-),score=3.77 TRINITY_DN294_c0_g3_i1:92-544(-)
MSLCSRCGCSHAHDLLSSIAYCAHFIPYWTEFLSLWPPDATAIVTAWLSSNPLSMRRILLRGLIPLSVLSFGITRQMVVARFNPLRKFITSILANPALTADSNAGTSTGANPWSAQTPIPANHFFQPLVSGENEVTKSTSPSLSPDYQCN